MEQIKHFIPSLMVIAVIAVAVSTGVQVVTMPIADATVPLASVDGVGFEAKNGTGAVKAAKPLGGSGTDNAPKLPGDNLDGKEYKDGTYYGSAKGYKSTITVAVKIKTKKIIAIKITDENEDKEYLDMAKRVIAMMLKMQSTNVDAVSGATYSSNGIIMAVRDALKKATRGKPSKAPASSATQAPKDPDPLPNDGLAGKKYKDGTYSGMAWGYKSNITVTLNIAAGKIATAEVTAHDDDADYVQKCQPILAAIVARQTTNVDAVSGCTYSSTGIILAAREALRQAVIDGADVEENAPIKIQDPDEGYQATYGQYADGTYSGKAIGFEGYIYVSVTIVSGDIASIEVTRHVEETSYYNSSIGVLDRIVRRQTVDGIDTVAGATFTSRGLLGAVDAALAKARII